MTAATTRPATLAVLAVFAGVRAVLAVGLTLNPRELPSPLIALFWHDILQPSDLRAPFV